MFLDSIQAVSDLRKLSPTDLPALCDELKSYIPRTTRQKKAHISSSLCVTELTVALHYVFDTPSDILIWDVSHQAYVHKVITDRKERFHTNRLSGGISGFTSRQESVFDPFGAGHSSTSISAIGGFAQAAAMLNIKRKHIAVIGDGALNGGMAYEALNHLGTSGLDILLILNDNESSIDPTIGALHEYQSYQYFFESLGWGYSGPVDGTDVVQLTKLFEREKHQFGTRVLHVKTKEVNAETGPVPELKDAGSVRVLYQDVFADELMHIASRDHRVVAVTPAMLSGSSLDRFMNVYPERCFDTGITEQHAVTFAAGLAASGMRPVVHLYSTFAQRAYDQIIHDVALQKLPVVFAIDRAGLVGEDGATHHGAFDLSYLNLVPNLEVLAPMDAAELRGMLNYALQQQGPVAIRYPRGGEPAGETLRHEIVFPSFRLLKPGKRAVVVSLGIMGRYVEEALSGNDVAHIDLRFLKPWNDALLKAALASYEVIFTIEDGSMRGGLRDTMANWLSKHLPGKKLVGIGLPDEFVGHGTPEELYESQGLSPSAIREMIDQTLATR